MVWGYVGLSEEITSGLYVFSLEAGDFFLIHHSLYICPSLPVVYADQKCPLRAI